MGMFSKIASNLFHPPYYRALKSQDPNSHLVFIEKVEKKWGFTSIDCVGFTSDRFADGLVEEKNAMMRSLYGEHEVYAKAENAQ